MNWDNFDANKVNPKIQKEILSLSEKYLFLHGLNKDNKKGIKTFIAQYLKDFKSKNQHKQLNETMGLDVFRPNEFSDNTENDQSLDELVHALSLFEYDWRKGSTTVQENINGKFETIGCKTISGGRAHVILDCLVKVGNKNVAIECETSNNLDNGYFSLRQAIKDGRADYGVMIVPWHSDESGRANEGKATDRLDRDCDENPNAIGPIYRIAIIRRLDIYKELAHSA